jgi:hypothetical protein
MRREVPLRRTGIVPNIGALHGPGSAAHHFVLRSVRGTSVHNPVNPAFTGSLLPSSSRK